MDLPAEATGEALAALGVDLAGAGAALAGAVFAGAADLPGAGSLAFTTGRAGDDNINGVGY